MFGNNNNNGGGNGGNNSIPNLPPSPQLANIYQQKIASLETNIDHLQQAIGKKQNDMRRLDAQNYRYQSLPFWMTPGNVGDTNRVVWPFWFNTELLEIPPETTRTSGFVVTQEAAFVAVSYTKAVYVRTTAPDEFTYLDPDSAVGGGKATDLTMFIRDAQSSRSYMDTQINMDHVGNPRFPTELHAPILILPRSNIEIIFQNGQAAGGATFAPFVTFFGYRVRIEDAQNILSTTTEYANTGY